MKAERLYYHDSYLVEFTATVAERSADGRRLYLDRTAFYPASGGQPTDHGSIDGIAVEDVVDEDGRIAHVTTAPVESSHVACAIDWPRRFDHMQQHSGQHLLSSVFVDLFGFSTLSFHLGQAVSTIDLSTGAVTSSQIASAERRANELVFENRPITVSFEQAAEAQDLRKASERGGELRVVGIEGVDRSACGGTHVRSTGEVGPILVRKLEKVRASVRVEFLCGWRAVRQARADFDALSRIAQAFSAPIEETPGLVAAQLAAVSQSAKLRRKLESELAVYQGRDLYSSTLPDDGGIRRVLRRLPAGQLEDCRGLAQSFVSQPKAVFLAIIEDPPSLLLATSADSGLDAGKLVKTVVTEAGGRGGGNPSMAQGSLPSREILERVVQKLQ